MDRLVAFAVIAVFILGCEAKARTHHYTVSVDEGVGTLTVRAQLSGMVTSLRARSDEAGRYTQDMRDCKTGDPIRPGGRRVRLASEPDQCITYRFDLAAVPSPGRRLRLEFPGNRIVSPTTWLWLPRLGDDSEIQVRFELPPGVNVSVPWAPTSAGVENAYRFGPSPQSANAMSVFGDFTYREIDVPGATLRVTLMGTGRDIDPKKITRWLAAAAGDVALTYGRFPNPSPQVVVIPVGAGPSSWGRSAVPFGRVIRDGGEAIQFFVNPAKPLKDYLGDWTATHEFSHLMLPYVRSSQKWISEGFASYYQNVLLARSGVYSEQRAWQKLYEGFERARKEPPVTPNQAGGSGLWNSRMMIYWSGAAIALMADVELREQGKSLDSVLGELQACCLPSGRVWRGQELFHRLDSVGETKVFRSLYNDYADAPGMPDMQPLYDRLGIVVRRGRVRLNDRAPAASKRRAIMAENADFAAQRGR